MQLKLLTSKLQDMVSRAVKGASNNRMVPLTSLMEIELTQGILTLRTTDASNILSIRSTNVEGPDFHIVVPCDTFSKLIAKTTTEYITLILAEDSLEVRGNGRYNLELPMDDEGKLIRFRPSPMLEDAKHISLSASVMKSILNANKAAVATTMETPHLTGYYFGDKVITTDGFRVCSNNEAVLQDPVLLPQEMVDLFSLMSEGTIDIAYDGKKIRFSCGDVTVQGSVMADIESYPVTAVENYLQTTFTSRCQLLKADLVDVLERLSLFVSIYDKNGVYLTFMPEAVQLSSKRSNGVETIPYKLAENIVEYTCCIDIELLKSQVLAQENELVDLWFGHSRAIKMVSSKITQIVSLLEDDRLSNG